jgi:DNA-binding NtrC family response regulator
MATAKVMVVDDEPGLRTMLAANLELEGFEVIEAENAEKALQMAMAGAAPDLVLTDIRMPGMNGVELFRALRAAQLRMPVVLMTGFALEELVQGALEEGAFTVLPKPFDVQHALRTVTAAAKIPVVLVVDDLANVAESTSAGLSAVGVKAASATTPAQALELLDKGAVDLCVVDLVMPEMDGAALAAKLKQLKPGLSIIAVSGFDVPELIRQVADVGVETVLKKPFGMRELVRSIATARGRALKPGASS